jgi:two-component system, NtrC family, nitrogen regulation sensor histidine kinase NtrY
MSALRESRARTLRFPALLLLGSGPPFVLACLLLWLSPWPRLMSLAVGLLMLLWVLTITWLASDYVTRILQTVSSLIQSIREGDYSLRARATAAGNAPIDALDEVYQEVNALSAVLQHHRLDEMDATSLLRSVMSEIEVALLTFDEAEQLLLLNPAAERLLAISSERALGQSAASLGLGDLTSKAGTHIAEHIFPGAAGRWMFRLSRFREAGVPRLLLMVEDVTRAMREEELQAWKRLVRVLGHEFNNSLAPISSIASSLSTLLSSDPLPHDWQQDSLDGLRIVGSRAESLTRFLEAYSRLARLPAPARRDFDLAALVRRIAPLEQRVPVVVEDGPALPLHADPDQLEQLLVNLLRNAAEASLESRGTVRIRWRREGALAELSVLDEGHGIANPANLFVPFFTTRPGGSGIGLVLCRQIAENHGGSIELANRQPGPGCEVRVHLPL